MFFQFLVNSRTYQVFKNLTNGRGADHQAAEQSPLFERKKRNMYSVQLQGIMNKKDNISLALVPRFQSSAAMAMVARFKLDSKGILEPGKSAHAGVMLQ
jgi:hypothetical protein